VPWDEAIRNRRGHPLPAGNLTSDPHFIEHEGITTLTQAVPPSEMTGPWQTEDAMPIGDSTTSLGDSHIGPLGGSQLRYRGRAAPLETRCIAHVLGEGEEAFD
jgi:hypothetical protein